MTVSDLFASVNEAYLLLDLTGSQRDNLAGAYEITKMYAKPEIQKKLIE